MVDVSWKDFFNSVLLLLLENFVSGFRLELKSIPWFSAACDVAIVHRNHFFCLCKQKKISESKVKFRQARGFLKLLNLDMLIKQKALANC